MLVVKPVTALAATDNIQILGRQAYLASQFNKARLNELFYYFILASCTGATLPTVTRIYYSNPHGWFPLLYLKV